MQIFLSDSYANFTVSQPLKKRKFLLQPSFYQFQSNLCFSSPWFLKYRALIIESLLFLYSFSDSPFFFMFHFLLSLLPLFFILSLILDPLFSFSFFFTSLLFPNRYCLRLSSRLKRSHMCGVQE